MFVGLFVYDCLVENIQKMVCQYAWTELVVQKHQAESQLCEFKIVLS